MRFPRLAGIVILAGLLARASPAAACSLCGCGDPLLASGDPAAITGQLRLQLDTEYVRVDAGTDGQPGFTDKLTQWSYRLNAVYRPIEALSLSVTVPLVAKAIRTVGGGASVTSSDLTGIGDVEVAARHALWSAVSFGARRVQEVALSLGSSLPTGKKDASTTDPATGDRLLVDPHGQVGTGGWGPFAGLHYRFEQGDWLAFASLSYRIRTEASYFDGTRYKFGDATLWSVHGQYRPLRRLALDLGLDGRRARADRATDAAGAVTPQVDNTGGTLLAAAPGVYFNPAGAVWLFLRAQVPVYRHLFGEQDVHSTVVTGVQFQAF
jgi:hypothetical protein